MNPEMKNINLSFGNLTIFKDFNIEFIENEINCILGPSGCGKTSLLNIISGLLQPDHPGKNDFLEKRSSYVFQDMRLLPWLKVDENIAFVLKDKLPPEEIKNILDEYLDMVRLKEFRNYYPGQLSGGMKQRVSLARAFSYPADVILMDEPFAGLDMKLKKGLIDAFHTLWNHRKVTVIWISHDIDEAVQPGRNTIVFSNPPVRILKTIRVTKENSDQARKEIIKIMEK